MNFNKAMLRAMLHSPVRNYAIPGLTSWLVGNPSPAGTVRFFECSRDHQENITPHSHRFNFQCWVIAGEVRNRVWTAALYGDQFTHTNLVYEGDIGQYRKVRIGVSRYLYHEDTYKSGEWYSMESKQIHSIQFTKGAQVLFLEGPTVDNQSTILEPFVDGQDVPTFKVEPWMFQRGAA